MLTSEQLDVLQAAAEAATPGPWEWEPPSEEDWPNADESLVTTWKGESGFPETVVSGWGYDASGTEASDEDRAFIAAWNPAVALEFVAAHRAVLKQRDDVAKRLSEYLDDSTGGQLSKPWYPVSVMVEDTKAHYAEIAESDHADSCENKDALDAALSRIARVEALHTAHTKNTVRHGSYVICDGCGGEWPCDTLRALTEGEPSE